MNTQTTTQNTPENNSEVTLSHYQIGGRKLRILGLSNPEKALQEITATMRYEDTLPYAIRKTGADVHHILDGVTNEGFSFEAPVVLMRGGEDIQSMLGDSGLQIKQDALFGKKISGYDFGHNFFEKTKNKTKSIASIIIDPNAVDETLEELGKDDFLKLEKSLATLFTYNNHDYTTHKHGLALAGETVFSSILSKYVLNLGNNIATKSELCSALFHKDIIEETSEHGLAIYESIEKNAKIFLEQVQKIKNPKLKKYWETIVKYPLFSLIDISSVSDETDSKFQRFKKSILGFFNMDEGELDMQDESDLMIDGIKKYFPEIPLKPTRWGTLMAIKEFEFSAGGGENINISLRDMRKIVLGNMWNKTENIDSEILTLLSAQLGVKTLENWDDYEKVLIARKLGLTDNASQEEIDHVNKVNNLSKFLDKLLGGILLENFGDMFVQYLELKDTEEKLQKYNNKNWKKIIFKSLKKYYKEEYNRIKRLKKRETKNPVSSRSKKHQEYYDTTYIRLGKQDIEDFLRQGEKIGIDTMKISQIDWFTENKNEADRILEGLFDVYNEEPNMHSFKLLEEMRDENIERGYGEGVVGGVDFQELEVRAYSFTFESLIGDMKNSESINDFIYSGETLKELYFAMVNKGLDVDSSLGLRVLFKIKATDAHSAIREIIDGREVTDILLGDNFLICEEIDKLRGLNEDVSMYKVFEDMAFPTAA